MLARAAEKMYWFGRYLERAESTARLLAVNSNLLLDLPLGVSQDIWHSLIQISGSDETFRERYGEADEQAVTHFILADRAHPGALINTVRMLWENTRATREIMPSEVAEQINEFYLYVKKYLKKNLSRSRRNRILDDMMNFCYQTTGFLLANMSDGQAYTFCRIGCNLERADMTSRTLDVGCLNLYTHKKASLKAYENIMWMNVLRSVSAYQMYRQHVQHRVKGKDVSGFLLQDEQFPRAVSCCLAGLARWVKKLPNNDRPLRHITRLQRGIKEIDPARLFHNDLHGFIDQLQIDLAAAHEQVANTWFACLAEEGAGE